MDIQDLKDNLPIPMDNLPMGNMGIPAPEDMPNLSDIDVSELEADLGMVKSDRKNENLPDLKDGIPDLADLKKIEIPTTKEGIMDKLRFLKRMKNKGGMSKEQKKWAER